MPQIAEIPDIDTPVVGSQGRHRTNRHGDEDNTSNIDPQLLSHTMSQNTGSSGNGAPTRVRPPKRRKHARIKPQHFSEVVRGQLQSGRAPHACDRCKVRVASLPAFTGRQLRVDCVPSHHATDRY